MGGGGSGPWEKGWNPWLVENRKVGRINGTFKQRKIPQPFYKIYDFVQNFETEKIHKDADDTKGERET